MSTTCGTFPFFIILSEDILAGFQSFKGQLNVSELGSRLG